MFDEASTYYDILNISPSASPQEVRDAYLQCKLTYQRDSVVLYSLVETDEREEILKKIEDAYAVLSNSERRREYDNHTGIISNLDNPFPRLEDQAQQEKSAKVVSIDRFPPMESFPDGDSILIPPSTDFHPVSTGNGASHTSHHPAPLPPAETSEPLVFGPTYPNEQGSTEESPHSKGYARITKTGMGQSGQLKSRRSQSNGNAGGATDPVQPPPALTAMAQQIVNEVEWSGPFLKKVRTATQVSIEEMSEITKVSKTYINAIEEENFERLPAGVYVRGFVVQIAKVLKLPSEKVASAFLSRYNAKRNVR